MSKSRTCYAIHALFAILLPWAALAEAPPPNSPTALGQRPRMLVTQSNRAAIREYIKTHYRADFQSWLDRFDDDDPSEAPAVSSERSVLNVWGPANLAFPVALGVDELKADGFRFPPAFDTPAELCAGAFAYATTDVGTGEGAYRSPVWNLVNNRSANPNRSTSYYLNSTDTTAFYLPTIYMYDWCHSELTPAQRATIAEAHWTRYTLRWQGLNLLNEGFATPQAASNRWPPHPDDTLFALAAWGDADVLDQGRRQTLYDTFWTLWINRFIWEVDTLYPEGWNWPEGADYWSYSGAAAIPYVIATIDMALGTRYMAERPFFTQMGAGQAAWMLPQSVGRTTGCGASGTEACTSQADPWGADTFRAGRLGCFGNRMTLGVSRFMAMLSEGATAATFQADANAGRWLLDNVTMLSRNSDCSRRIDLVPWATWLFYKFLFGTAGTTPVAPSKLNHVLGAGAYFFRSGYQTDATHMTVSALRYTFGHDSQDFGTFTLHKFGNLVVNAHNYRSGSCRVASPPSNHLVRNSVGIHSGTDDVDLGFDSHGGALPAFKDRGIGNVIYVRGLPPVHSFGQSHSYVSMDYGPSWKQASKMQRELVYLRGSTDHEYLVILDRADVVDPVNDPIWKMWVTAKPTCVDGPCANPRPGKWTTSGKVLSVTNEHGGLGPFGGMGTEFTLPPTHGRLFLKSLLPADARLQVLGDDGSFTLQYQTGNDDGTTLEWREGGCVPGHYDLYGWGRIEVRPGVVGRANTFLNVIQLGDSRTLARMSPSDVVESEDGTFVVTRILDAERNRFVAFAKDETVGPTRSTLAYTIVASTTDSDHVVANLAPATTYYIRTEGAPTMTVRIARANNGGLARTSDAAGVLDFSVMADRVVAAPKPPAGIRQVLP